MILVVGGTGHLGRVVVRRLLDARQDVRVMSRGAAGAADLAQAGAELFPGDVRDRARVQAAMEGATVCVSAVQGFSGPGRQSPETVDRDGNMDLVDAARVAGSDVVMVSAVEAGPHHPLSLHRMKWEAEEYLRRSGVAWTVVRSTPLAETWADLVRQSRDRAGHPRVLGRGENPINFVSVEDVATAVVRAVDDRGLRGHVIEVGGPDNLTFNAFARLVEPDHEPRHVPRTLLRVVAVAARPFSAQLTRIAGAALDMDTHDKTFDPAPSVAAHPWLTPRSVTTLALRK